MKWALRTFDDLIFNRDLITKLRIATDDFVNGYGVRVEETVDGYDVFVLKSGVDCTTTHLDSGNMKSLSKLRVSDYMRTIQKFGDQLW